MREETIIETFKEKELNEISEELFRFLSRLDEEKRTLFPELRSDESYPEVCRKLVDATILVAVALSDKRIVGASGMRRTKKGFLGGFWPVLRGYTVVAEDFQGRGIGSRLMEEKNRAMKKLFAYHVAEVVRGNFPMERVFEKSSYRMIHRDESYTYYYKACRDSMKLLTPIFEPAYRRSIKRREPQKIHARHV